MALVEGDSQRYFKNTMPSAHYDDLTADGRVTSPSRPNRAATEISDLRLQLRDEIDRLALVIRELKAQADSVQKAADALGEELLFDSSEVPSAVSRVSHRDGRLIR